MERNSLGQVIVKENESSVIQIPCRENFITLDQYNRFLLDNKEFTELIPTIDKDALIAELSAQVNTLSSVVNNLTEDIKGGFLVSVATPQYAKSRVIMPNAITYQGQQVYESIGFDDDSTSPNFNSRQSNGLKYWSIPEKAARVYLDANSERTYDMEATIKFRFKYIGLTDLNNVSSMNTSIRFWRDGVAEITPQTGGVLISPFAKQSYKTGEVSEEFQINVKAGQTLGNNVIYLPVNYFIGVAGSPLDMSYDFLMEVLPGSTFSFLPR